VEPAAPEPSVFQKSSPEVPEADECQGPLAVDPQDVPQGRDQLLDPVTDPGVTELAEEAKVLPDLGVVDRECRTELAARNGRISLPLKDFKLAEVQADPPHNGLWGQFITGRLASRLPHGVGDSQDCGRKKAKSMPPMT
jgi:hypothetical protein